MTAKHLEAEQAVIGSILISPECLPVVEAELCADDFSLAANRDIYRAAVALSRLDEAVDPVTILEELKRQKCTVSSDYMMSLMNITPTAANVEEYARITHEYSIRRAIQTLGNNLVSRIDEHDTTAEVLAEASRQVEELQANGVQGDLIAPSDAAMAFYQHRQDVDEGKSSGFIQTGYRDIDNMLGGGLLCSGMYIMAARPGMGKTSMALNIADRVAERAGPVLFVSLEMDTEQIMAKRISRLCGVPSNRLLMGKLTDQEARKMAEGTSKASQINMFINRKPAATVDDIASMARKVRGLKLIVVDYIGKISPGNRKNAGRTEYMTEISGDLKTMARMFHVPVLALCQLNREVEKRTNREPQLSDLRDTGAVEQDADGVIFLYREDYYSEKRGVDQFAPSPLEVILEKNRHGATGRCEMAFCMPLCKISPISNDPRRIYRETLKSEQMEEGA